MKKLILTLQIAILTTFGFSQTATDFTVNDCNSVEHHLFEQLNNGKVVVICWVMPCGTCVGPATTTYNVVQSFQATNPDKVIMYLCDDYGNTDCLSLNSWANTNNLTKTTRFSNSTINMTNYGTAGMPKIVVVAGNSHKVFFNANNTVNGTTLQSAISAALLTAGVEESKDIISSIDVFPNPSNISAEVNIKLIRSMDVSIELFNIEGCLVQNLTCGNLPAGENKFPFDVSELANGIYMIKVYCVAGNRIIKFMVSH